MAEEESESSEFDEESYEEYVQNTPLVSLLTPAVKVRILSAFIAVNGDPMNPSSIVQKASVGTNAWYRHREELIDNGIVEEAGHAGNSPLYRVDMTHPVIKRLAEIKTLYGRRDVDDVRELAEKM